MKYEAIKLRAHRYMVRPIGQLNGTVRFVKASSEAEAIAKVAPSQTQSDLSAVL